MPFSRLDSYSAHKVCFLTGFLREDERFIGYPPGWGQDDWGRWWQPPKGGQPARGATAVHGYGSPVDEFLEPTPGALMRFPRCPRCSMKVSQGEGKSLLLSLNIQTCVYKRSV